MAEFYYVYMLSDAASHTHHYVGMTKDLKSRLKMHNSRQVIHTSRYAPWELDAAIAVRSKKVASELELYLNPALGGHLQTSTCLRRLWRPCGRQSG